MRALRRRERVRSCQDAQARCSSWGWGSNREVDWVTFLAEAGVRSLLASPCHDHLAACYSTCERQPATS